MLKKQEEMDSVRSCKDCGLGFKRVGFLSVNERIKAHEEIEHSVCCSECQDKFVSLPHLWYHIEMSMMPNAGTVFHSVKRSVPLNMRWG